MVRAFTAADVRQADSGQVTSAPTQNVTLPGGTLEGNAAVVVVGGNSIFDPPPEWSKLAAAGSLDDKTPQLIIGVRADVPAGESSWPVTFLGGASGAVLWTIAEWSNVSYCPLVARDYWPNTATGLSSVSFSAAMRGDVAAPYTVAIAAVLSNGSVSATSGWSPTSWSNGFVQTDALTLGTGQNTGDTALWVARRYGTLNETGPWTTTMTWTNGAQTGKNAYGALAVIRAENLLGDI